MAVFVEHLLPDDVGDTIFDKLMEECKWYDLVHRGITSSRYVSLQGNVTDNMYPLYRYPSDTEHPVNDWTPTVKLIRDYLQIRFGYNCNHVKIQLYPNGESAIGYHSDKTLDIKRGSTIVNCSFSKKNVSRTFVIKNKITGELTTFTMNNNSMVTFDTNTNMKFLHKIKKEDDSVGPRISLVFRTIDTFVTIDDKGNKNISGQGSVSADKSISKEDQRILLYRAFREENDSSEFDWDKWYGTGFDILY